MINWTERAKAVISKKCCGGTVKTDESKDSTLLSVLTVPGAVISANQERFLSVLSVSPPVELKKPDSAAVLIEDPDRWCWPHSNAMTGREIETFLVRLERIKYFGLEIDQAEKLADRLVVRDREDDERSVCLECMHLRIGLRCLNSQNAGVCIKHTKSNLPSDFVIQLQRCPGFKSEIGGKSGAR